MTQYLIRRVYLFPAFKFGCLVGGLVLLLPGLLLGLLARAIVAALRGWLESWTPLDVSTALASPLNLLEQLKLAEFLRNLQTLDDQGWLLVLGVSLSAAVAGGLLLGLLATYSAAGYNILAGFSGGLVVSAEALNAVALPVGPTAGSLPPKGRTMPLPRNHPAQAPKQQPQVSNPNPSAPASAWLSHSQNPAQRWSLKTATTTLGSTPGSDISLPGLISRHAEIRFENNRYILYDLSGGQTFVNGRLINGSNMLKNGFRIRLMTHELIFQA